MYLSCDLIQSNKKIWHDLIEKQTGFDAFLFILLVDI